MKHKGGTCWATQDHGTLTALRAMKTLLLYNSWPEGPRFFVPTPSSLSSSMISAWNMSQSFHCKAKRASSL